MVVLEGEQYHIWFRTVEMSQMGRISPSLKRDGTVQVQSMCGEESKRFQARMQTGENI